MSVHYSKFDLNTYLGTPYFQAHVPADYPLRPVLEKCRAFRRLPPRLRELSALAKRWAARVYGGVPDGLADIEQWYDSDGYELNPATGKRLTDAEIDAEWERWQAPDIEVKDIPVPKGGFADPGTWEPESTEEDEPDPDEGISEAQLLSDIASHGREYVAKEYGVPADRLAQVGSDADLARIIRGVVAG